MIQQIVHSWTSLSWMISRTTSFSLWFNSSMISFVPLWFCTPFSLQCSRFRAHSLHCSWFCSVRFTVTLPSLIPLQISFILTIKLIKSFDLSHLGFNLFNTVCRCSLLLKVYRSCSTVHCSPPKADSSSCSTWYLFISLSTLLFITHYLFSFIINPKIYLFYK
jgi:hypothetical protein